MKKTLLSVILWFLMFAGQAQQNISILFVNDNAVFAPNTDTMLYALQHTGFAFDVFDAVAQGRSPEYNELKDYDLVFWYTSTDGVGLYFWNGTDENNPHIIEYLNNGGKLVVMGNDFLYDRFATPSTFAPGEFVYDYLGTLVYYAQSYGDDGGQGVPRLDLVEGQSIATLNPVQWIYPTLWWVDACLPIPGAQPVYQMGPPSYPLADYYSAIYYHPGNFATLSLFFDPALIDTYAHRLLLVGDIIHYFQNMVGIHNETSAITDLNIWPSPAATQLHISLTQNKASRILISNSTGQVVKQIRTHGNEKEIRLDVSKISPGIYNVTLWPTMQSRKFVIVR